MGAKQTTKPAFWGAKCDLNPCQQRWFLCLVNSGCNPKYKKIGGSVGQGHLRTTQMPNLTHQWNQNQNQIRNEENQSL